MADKTTRGVRVATSLSILFDREYRTDACDMLKRLRDAGFEYIDMDFWDWGYDKRSPFISDGWEDWVKRIKECGDGLGIKFCQAHAVDTDPFHNPEDREWNDELIRRCIVGAGILGIDWTVFHCAFAMDADENEKTRLRRNIEYFKPLIELAAKNGTGLALENMQRRENGLPYPTCADEQCRLIDSFSAANVGACLDTGHAHCNGLDQYAEIIKLGDRLKALHIHDNEGVRCTHLPPFHGTMDWKSFMRGLREVNYGGVFTFEADTMVRNAPDRASEDAACRMMYCIGKYLMEMDV